jgi:glycosyltransferase involved in cell wall biosynthesis
VPGVEQVLMLTNAVAPDKLGGLERYVRELSAALVRKGVPVTVLAKQMREEDPTEEVGDDGVRILRHSVPSKSERTFAVRYPFCVAAGVVREVRRIGPHGVIHGHYAVTTLPVALMNRPYLYSFHAPVHKELLLEHGGSYLLPEVTRTAAVRSLRAAERRVVARASGTVVVSEFSRGQLGELSYGAAHKSRLIAGGIDTERFSPGGVDREPWARSADPLIFTARRLVERTGVSELVQAMPLILAGLPAAKLAIAGDGHQRSAIDDQIRRLGIGRSVRVLGRVDDAELLRWYRNADLTVTPTQMLEGFGLSTGESMAVGTPALVTPIGANPELVRDLDPLLVAPGRRPVDLAQAVLGLVERKGLLGLLRARARSRAHPQWSWDHVSDRYLELYERFVS